MDKICRNCKNFSCRRLNDGRIEYYCTKTNDAHNGCDTCNNIVLNNVRGVNNVYSFNDNEYIVKINQ